MPSELLTDVSETIQNTLFLPEVPRMYASLTANSRAASHAWIYYTILILKHVHPFLFPPSLQTCKWMFKPFELLTLKSIVLPCIIEEWKLCLNLATNNTQLKLQTILNARNQHFQSTSQLATCTCSTPFVAVTFRATEDPATASQQPKAYPLTIMRNFLLSKAVLQSSPDELSYYLLRFVGSKFCRSSFFLTVHTISRLSSGRVPSELLDFCFHSETELNRTGCVHKEKHTQKVRYL